MVLVYDGSSVTSPKNWNNPHPGDPCYALHTDSRNYVVIALEGNGARPSHIGKGYSEDGKMYTLNKIEQHSVCYGISRSCLCGGNGSNGGMPIGDNVQPTITANGCGAVAYAIENHPNDSRVKIEPDGIVQTLSSRMGTGDNNTPFVLITSTKADTQSGNHTTLQASVQKADNAGTEAKDWFVMNSSGDGIAAPIDARLLQRARPQSRNRKRVCGDDK